MTEKVTKKGMIARAMTALGDGAGPASLRAYVKDHYNTEMSAEHASTAKGEILRARRAEAEREQFREAMAQRVAGEGKEEKAHALVRVEDVAFIRSLAVELDPRQLDGLRDVLTRVDVETLRELIGLLAE